MKWICGAACAAVLKAPAPTRRRRWRIITTCCSRCKSDVAQNYFSLRSLDAEIATVAGTVDLRHEQVELVRSRFEGGIGSELDVAQAETELATTEADAAALAQQRDELENAIAMLVGKIPPGFNLAADNAKLESAATANSAGPAGGLAGAPSRRGRRPSANSPPPTPRSA
jgi:outer membrane protein TolC